MEIDCHAHSIFLLNYYLIMVVKYRRKVFDDVISERAKEIFSKLHLITISLCRSGNMMAIMFMCSSGLIIKQQSVNS